MRATAGPSCAISAQAKACHQHMEHSASCHPVGSTTDAPCKRTLLGHALRHVQDSTRKMQTGWWEGGTPAALRISAREADGRPYARLRMMVSAKSTVSAPKRGSMSTP